MSFKLKLKPQDEIAKNASQSASSVSGTSGILSAEDAIISAKFKILKHREHVLLRNNMYIGSKVSQDESVYVYDE